jgi:hypothetical protein
MDQRMEIPQQIVQPAGVLSLQRASGEAGRPRDGDHLIMTVRALSARLIKGAWVEIPVEVLQAAAGALKGMPVLLNHTLDVREVVGMVLESWWDDTAIQGAPGINARLRLHRASVPPNLLRELEADPPFKPSVSVSWTGEVEQSHPDLSRQEFWRRLGDILGGERVRWIVTRIDELPEISLVWSGADPAARALSRKPKPERSLDMPGNENKDTGKVAAQAALERVAEALGLDTAEADGQVLIGRLQEAAQGLRRELDELRPLAEMGRAHLEARRQECLRLAGLAKGGEVPEALKRTIQEASLAAVEALIEGFGGQVAKTFTARCPLCGEEVPIRSSLEAQEPPARGMDKYEQLGRQVAGMEVNDA